MKSNLSFRFHYSRSGPSSHSLSTFLDRCPLGYMITMGRQSNMEKVWEILVLRQQISILQHRLNSHIKPSRIQKLTLSILAVKLKQVTDQTINQLKSVIRIFQPESVICWHRELVRRKWTCSNNNNSWGLSISKEPENTLEYHTFMGSWTEI